MALLQTIQTISYKGHEVARVESPLQVFFVVDGDYSNDYWSMADAKRAINGQGTVSLPVDIRHMNN